MAADARLMPTNYVRPYSKDDKNDYRDAEAIAEAVQRPTMKLLRPRRPTNLICKPCIGCGAVAAILSGMLRFEHTGMGAWCITAKLAADVPHGVVCHEDRRSKRRCAT